VKSDPKIGEALYKQGKIGDALTAFEATSAPRTKSRNRSGQIRSSSKLDIRR
jgi:hypothetical protein